VAVLSFHCSVLHDSNWIIKFGDDTTVIGLISNNDEKEYRDEVAQLTPWCKDNSLVLDVSKTNSLIVDFRNNRGPHSTISLDGTPVEIVYSFHFLGLQISDSRAWTHKTGAMLKKAHQHLYPLQ